MVKHKLALIAWFIYPKLMYFYNFTLNRNDNSW